MSSLTAFRLQSGAALVPPPAPPVPVVVSTPPPRIAISDVVVGARVTITNVQVG